MPIRIRTTESFDSADEGTIQGYGPGYSTIAELPNRQIQKQKEARRA
jgi:hypothetical protein